MVLLGGHDGMAGWPQYDGMAGWPQYDGMAGWVTI